LIASFARKLSVLLLAAALLAGCTATFTYKHLDWLIPWYVDGYVDLSRDQRRLLQDQLGPALQWHQQEELARYVEILDQIESDLARDVSAEQIQRWADDIISAAERVEERMLSVALDFGSELSDQQIDEFVESLWTTRLINFPAGPWPPRRSSVLQGPLQPRRMVLGAVLNKYPVVLSKCLPKGPLLELQRPKERHGLDLVGPKRPPVMPPPSVVHPNLMQP
jgi:hypothetical protein